MDIQRLVAVVFLLAGFFILCPISALSQVQQINLQRIDVTRLPDVQLYFTVTDEAGNCVLGLNDNEIEISLDSVVQSISRLESALEGDEYLAVVLLFDRSGSMKNSLDQAKAAAQNFADRLSREDRMAVISFDDQVRIDSGLSSDRLQIKAAIESIELGNDTAFYDAIEQALILLENEPTNRQAVIVISDGRDTRSRQQKDEVLALIKEREIPLFAIGQGDRPDTGNLTEFAKITGGAFFQAADPNDLLSLYQMIAEQLINQYVLEFISSFGQDEKWHDLSLKVKNTQTGDASVSREFLAVRGVGVNRATVARHIRGLEQQNMLLVIGLGAGIGLIIGMLLLLLIRLSRPRSVPAWFPALGLLVSAAVLGAVLALILVFIL